MKNTPKRKHWLSYMIWKDEADIQKTAEDYNKQPWYTSLRFGFLCLVFGSIILTSLFFTDIDWISATITLVPFAYFVMRGYRFAFVFLGSLKLIDSLMMLFGNTLTDDIHLTGGIIISIVSWTALWIGIAISCYRIETIRRKKDVSSRKVSTMDKVVFIIMALWGILCAWGYYIEKTDVRIQLENKYGEQNVKIAEEMYIYGISVPQICQSEWEKMLQDYNKNQTEQITYDDLLSAYLQNYSQANGDIFESLPNGLFEDYQKHIGDTTTKDIVVSLVKKSEKDENIVFTFCSNILNMSDDDYKIKTE